MQDAIDGDLDGAGSGVDGEDNFRHLNGLNGYTRMLKADQQRLENSGSLTELEIYSYEYGKRRVVVEAMV